MNSKINKFSPLGSEKIASYLDKNGSVLEIGSGKGETLRYLLDLGYSVTGIDKDASSGEKSITDGYPVIAACAEDLPFDDETFDQVLFECVFSLCSPEKTIAEITRVLKPAGKVVLTDLYSSGSCETIETNSIVRNLFTAEKLSEYFGGYTLEYFEDSSDALTDFAADLLLNGSPECCVDIKEIVKRKPKYGIWIYRKNRL